jgi:hypothetical protein
MSERPKFFAKLLEQHAPPSGLITYRALRTIVGIIAFALPLLLPLVCLVIGPYVETGYLPCGPEDSLSDYYGTWARNEFVGLVIAIGFFLFGYDGYTVFETYASKVAAVALVGVALFPDKSIFGWVPYVHIGCACVFFVTVTLFSICFFTRSEDREVKPVKYLVALWGAAVPAVWLLMFFVAFHILGIPAGGVPLLVLPNVCVALLFLFAAGVAVLWALPKPKKLKDLRNVCYLVLGGGMGFSLLVFPVSFFCPRSIPSWLAPLHPVYCVETIALWCFGLGWAIKGEMISFLNDDSALGARADRVTVKLSRWPF